MARSLYFLPALITLSSIALAILLLLLDKGGPLSYPLAEHWWNDASSARDFLSTSASVMITIASVAFSVVVVALTLASNQFCPRVLGRFIEDRMNRVVFGMLIGNFAFAMVGLSHIQEDEPLPGLTLSACFLFDLVSTGLFIYFIHHISSSLQVDSIVRTTRQETLQRIAKLKSNSQEFGFLGPADMSPHRLVDLSLPCACPISKLGYVQAIRASELLAISQETGQNMTSRIGLGDFVTPESTCVLKPAFPLNDELESRLRNCYEVDYLRPEDYLTLLSDQLIHHSAGSPRVSEALLEMLGKVAGYLEGETWKDLVATKSQLVVATATQASVPPFWLERLRHCQATVEKVCCRPPAGATGIVSAD